MYLPVIRRRLVRRIVGVHLVLPICGNQRSSVFGKFLATFDAMLLGDKHLRGSTFLLLVFCDDDSRSKHSIESSNANVHVLVLHKPSFSRAEAMNAGAAHVYGNLKTSGLPEEAIVFFIDVDMQITGATLNRVRYNTWKGEVSTIRSCWLVTITWTPMVITFTIRQVLTRSRNLPVSGSLKETPEALGRSMALVWLPCSSLTGSATHVGMRPSCPGAWKTWSCTIAFCSNASWPF